VRLTLLTAIVSAGSLHEPIPSGANERSDCAESGVIVCPERGDDLDWNAAPIPYIVQPRLTNIIDRRPVLEWASVPGATRYAIELTDGVTGEAIVSLPAVTTTRIDYPEDAPDLEPDTYYELEVTADTGEGSWQAATNDGVVFEVLPLARAADYTAQLQTLTISALDLDDVDKTIAQAELQRRFGLYQTAAETYRAGLDAITIDQTIPDRHSDASFILWQQLGNLYWNDLELVPEAAIAYENAYAIEPTGALAEQLGAAMLLLGDRDRAVGYWDAAIAVYTAIGDETAVQRVQMKRDRIRDRS
jgi:hypothetical protein